MQSKIVNFIVKLTSLLLFGAVCYAALFFAYGYQYDAKKKDVVKTSIIDLIGNTKEARVLLDGKLVANFLPYQIKGVDPGTYEVSIAKTGFLPWKRVLAVEADIVTIVNDILLVPDKLEDFIKLLKVYDQAAVLHYGKDLVFNFEKESKVVHIFSMFNDGTYRDEDLELAIEGITNVDALDNDRFLVHLNSGEIYYFDFSARKFVDFYKPKDAYGFTLNKSGNRMFYLVNGVLYGAWLDNLLKEASPDGFGQKLAEQVQAVGFGFAGEVYFIAGGVPYKTNENFSKVNPLALNLKKYINLAFVEGRNFGLLVLRDEAGGRSLYLADKKGRLSFLTDKLSGKPYFNDFDQLIFADSEGNLVYFDPNLKEKKNVRAGANQTEIVGWFSNEGHYIYKESGKVYLGDVFNANVYPLLDSQGISKIFIFNKNLFYLKDGKLYALNWKSIL